MSKKIKVRLKPYNSLKDEDSTFIPIKAFYEMKDPYCFSIYVYLCMREQNYSITNPICSYKEMSEDCKIGKTKCKECIKWLHENGYINKYRVVDFDGTNMSNEYKVNYDKVIDL